MPNRAINILLALSSLLLAGLLWSRALLSISIGLMGVYGLFYWLKNGKPFSQKALFIWCCSPILILFTGMYQDPFAAANNQLLLTYLVYPIAGITAMASADFQFSKIMTKPWVSAALIAIIYPLGWFFLNSTTAIEQYGIGKSLPVFMDNDHIRFSMFLCSALLFTLLPFHHGLFKKIAFVVLFIAILFLAVRTAWVMALIVLIGYGIHLLLQTALLNKKFVARIIIALLFITALLWSFPTVHQKINYTIYDWQQYNQKGYDSSYSDGVRRAINSVAWKAIQNENATTIGWEAIPATIKKKFTQEFNGSSTQFGWPFNQWLFWWMGSGWIGMLLMSCWLLYPAWHGLKNKNPILVIWTIAIAISCLVESTLNYQYGVFLHVWPIVIGWQAYQKNYGNNL